MHFLPVGTRFAPTTFSTTTNLCRCGAPGDPLMCRECFDRWLDVEDSEL